MFKQFDFSVVKRFSLVGRTNAEFRFDVLNLFNTANFVPVSGMTPGSPPIATQWMAAIPTITR